MFDRAANMIAVQVAFSRKVMAAAMINPFTTLRRPRLR